MRILISNDDGVHAPGITALHRALARRADCWVVAPMLERSTAGHGLTLHKPLRIVPVGDRIFGVSGTPADCVYLALRKIMPKKPDLVISGINQGANLGQDVYYSGTVAAAREACILGIPAIAVSLYIRPKSTSQSEIFHFKTATQIILRLIAALPKHPIPSQILLNVNVPNLPPERLKGFKAVPQGYRYYGGQVIERKDHRGKPYYWVGGQHLDLKNEDETDCDALSKNYAAVSPLQLDCTNKDYLRRLLTQHPEWQWQS